MANLYLQHQCGLDSEKLPLPLAGQFVQFLSGEPEVGITQTIWARSEHSYWEEGAVSSVATPGSTNQFRVALAPMELSQLTTNTKEERSNHSLAEFDSETADGVSEVLLGDLHRTSGRHDPAYALYLR